MDERVERLSTLLKDEGISGLDFRLSQSSDETGEYYVTEATVFCDQNPKLLDLISADGDWSDTTLALFCNAVNLVPDLIAERSRLLAALEEAEGRMTQVAGDDVWWKTVIGEGATHTPSGEVPSIKHLHPLTVKPIYEAHKGTAVADVIAGLIFNLAISTNREQFLVKDALDRAQAAEARAEASERREAGLRAQVDGLRPEVLAFAHLMEAQLRANDHKPGWKKDGWGALLHRLREEADQLDRQLLHAYTADYSDRGARVFHDPKVIAAKRTAHVANFAMMIADVCGAITTKSVEA